MEGYADLGQCCDFYCEWNGSHGKGVSRGVTGDDFYSKMLTPTAVLGTGGRRKGQKQGDFLKPM